MNTENKPQICLLASAETSPGVLYGLFDVLSTVGAAYSDMISGVPDSELLDIKIVAKTDQPFRCVGNIVVEPHLCIDDIAQTDAIIVCDMYAPIDVPPKGAYVKEVAWLKRMYGKGALLTSVCSGSAILAETGLLNGHEISGHWAYRHMFAEHYPQITWREDAIINFSAEHKRLITTGGVTSWQDLAIYLIERYCGLQHAIYTSKVHLLSPHTEGQLPFAAMTKKYQTSDAVIAESQSWIEKNLASHNPVSQMTEQSGLKPRTFARRFREATNYQPIDYVQNLRIESAKNLLETEDRAIDEISATVGYEDPASFRRLFKRKVGITPAHYRKKFMGIARASRRLDS
ncbi:MAG: transcriptional regulator GlxA family with amidase domain [Planctomycetota bacterium]